MKSLRIALVSLSLFAAPPAGQAQEGMKRIGYLSPNTPALGEKLLNEFREGLREHGFIEGQNINIEIRYAEGRPERIPVLAAELVALQPDLIAAVTTPPNRALNQLTRTIPVVMIAVGDPIALGLIDSLARPGRNFTGMSDNSIERAIKGMQLFRELLPDATTIAVL
jgi:putative ABC transport system substrate-binding protein